MRGRHISVECANHPVILEYRALGSACCARRLGDEVFAGAVHRLTFVKLENQVAGLFFADIPHVVGSPAWEINERWCFVDHTVGLDAPGKEQDCYLVLIAMTGIASSRLKHSEMSVQLIQEGCRPLKDELNG